MASGRALMAEPRGKASVARSTIAGTTGFVFHALGVDLQGDFTGCRNNRFGLSFRGVVMGLRHTLGNEKRPEAPLYNWRSVER